VCGNVRCIIEEPRCANVIWTDLVAGSVPKLTLHLLETGLQNSSREERLAIRGNQRRELVRTLEQLLFRSTTSHGAMRLMWLLAEAENEDYSNNATGILAECFHPLHLQMPLSLQDRLELLREFTSEKISKEGKLVAIDAIRISLRHTASFLVRHGTGLDLLDARPVYTYREVYDYRRDLVDLLISLSMGEDEVAVRALSELPQMIVELGIQARPEEALDRFIMLVDWACSSKAGLEVSSLVSGLRLVQETLSKKLGGPAFPRID
jgi:hypothetical protein